MEGRKEGMRRKGEMGRTRDRGREKEREWEGGREGHRERIWFTFDMILFPSRSCHDPTRCCYPNYPACVDWLC